MTGVGDLNLLQINAGRGIGWGEAFAKNNYAHGDENETQSHPVARPYSGPLSTTCLACESSSEREGGKLGSRERGR